MGGGARGREGTRRRRRGLAGTCCESWESEGTREGALEGTDRQARQQQQQHASRNTVHRYQPDSYGDEVRAERGEAGLENKCNGDDKGKW